ncbi:ABC transporter substrate-binding protein [Archangium violaceum]|uniref:ABC transporter substrate-binding protein n=1 Tax=Archangium violaceum TaxID=83451 RepID=UPI00193BE202|nr:ABC transporter substrate-binding protein [Archangium violaceum]QRK10039.1 ABC transporter substrate-binding protein [Archangium violaceum]
MLRALAMSCLFLLLMVGCTDKKGSPPPAGPQGQGRTLKKVSVVLDWYPNAVHIPILAADQQGFFSAEGLDVNIKMPADNPTDGIKLVGAGSETFALYYAPDVLLAQEEGIPIVSVGAIVRRPLNGIMVPESSGIQSPKELEGKQVGYPSTPLSISLVSSMVRAAGGDPKKVVMTDVSWDLLPAVTTQRVQAVTGAFVNHEKPLFEKKGVKVRYFAPTEFGVPNYYELVLITGKQTASQDAATVEAMLRAMAKGYAWAKANQAAALKLLLEKQSSSFPLDAEIEEQALRMLLPWMEEEGVRFGAQDAKTWEEISAWLQREGRLKGSLKSADAFINVVR